MSGNPGSVAQVYSALDETISLLPHLHELSAQLTRLTEVLVTMKESGGVHPDAPASLT